MHWKPQLIFSNQFKLSHADNVISNHESHAFSSHLTEPLFNGYFIHELSILSPNLTEAYILKAFPHNLDELC